VFDGEALELLGRLTPGSVDAVVTDPPYSSGGTSNAQRTQQAPSTKYVSSGAFVCGPDFAGDNRDQRSHILWSTLWLSAARRASKLGAILVTFSDWRQLPATTDAVQAGGWVWRGIAVWSKTRGRPRLGGFRNQAEFVVWGSNGPMAARAGAPCLPGVIVASPPSRNERVHITQKPLDLLEELVRVAPPGGLVLDPFTGSGTTGVAALRQGRRFMGFELVPAYVEIARGRIGQVAEQLDGASSATG
jgi:site-specific DNA-methyltransferase (adenine-specific)